MGTGGVYRFKDGSAKSDDHIYATFEYPGGRTAIFSSIESNAFEHYYEAFLRDEGHADSAGRGRGVPVRRSGTRAATGVEVPPRGGGPALAASESRAADAAAAARRRPPANGTIGCSPTGNEISGFCAAIRVGRPLRCGADRAIHSAAACIRADEAVQQKTRLLVAPVATT